MKTMNLDKLIIGFLLGVCLMLALGAGGKDAPQDQERWEVIRVGPGGYLLDRTTGQLWWLDQANKPQPVSGARSLGTASYRPRP